MRFASGGFRGQVRHDTERIIADALTEWSMDKEPDGPPAVNIGFVLLNVATYYPTPLADQAFRAALRERLEHEVAEIVRIWVEAKQEHPESDEAHGGSCHRASSSRLCRASARS